MLSPCEYEVYLEHPVCVTVMSPVAEGYRITGEFTGCIVSLLPFDFTFIRIVVAHRYGRVWPGRFCGTLVCAPLGYRPGLRTCTESDPP